MTTQTEFSPHWWQWPTILSLDAPLVAVVWQQLFAGLGAVAIHWPEVAVLGMSVWLAYAADRWFEAWTLREQPIATARHAFYARHLRVVAAVWVAVLVADLAIALLHLTARELVFGMVLLMPVLFYVLSHQLLHREYWWRAPKEVLVAVLIAAGSSVFVASAPGRLVLLAATVGLFAMLCFVNVALIGAWEIDVDRQHARASLARQFSIAPGLIRTLPFVVTGVAVFVAVPALSIPAEAAHCVAASAVLLAIVDRFEPALGRQAARVLADVALLTPLVPLARGWFG